MKRQQILNFSDTIKNRLMEFSMISSSDQSMPLYRCAEVKELDRTAIENEGIAGIRLMKRAGRALLRELLSRWPEPRAITVLCGAGNNGGDGYVLAALAAQRALPVRVLCLANPEKLKGDARSAYEYAVQEGVGVSPFSLEVADNADFQGGIIVDAMLGIGLSGAVRESYVEAIAWINQSAMPVVAADIPSGLCGDTGAVLGTAVRADVTVTFIGCKQGLLTGRGRALSGEVVIDELDVPPTVYQAVTPQTHHLSLSHLQQHLLPREIDAHKGSFGHVMVIGGDRGLGGAAAMAAEAAARSGAGLVSVATQPEHITALLARRPEIMVVGVPSGQELIPFLERPTVLVLGPGLGHSAWSEQMLQQAAASGLPMVLDADGLNILSEGRVLPQTLRDNWVLTPHPGEAARLLGVSTEAVQADRFQAVRDLQARYDGTVVLKGAGSLIFGASGMIGVATEGNPGMASGGMGDVLSGVIGALMAQGIDMEVAAQLAVCAHGAAGDLAVEEGGERGLLATDLVPYIRELLNPL